MPTTNAVPDDIPPSNPLAIRISRRAMRARRRAPADTASRQLEAGRIEQ
jgi:hypothetical protein